MPGTYDFLCAFHSDMRGSISVVAAAGSGAAAESDGASGGSKAPAAPAPTPTPTPLAPAPAAPSAPTGETPPNASVDVVDFEFRAPTVTVAAGGSVTWTNSGLAPHTVSAKDGSFGSGMLETGAMFKQSFATVGTYAYLCQVHPEMTGAIEVTAPAGPAQAAPAAAAPSTTAAAHSTEATAPEQLATGPVANLGSLPGIVLSVTLVSVASALFARLLKGTTDRG